MQIVSYSWGSNVLLIQKNIIKMVGVISEKIENFNFSFIRTSQFRGRGKTKNISRDISKRTLDIEFERDRSNGLASMFGDGHIDKHTHTHTLSLSLSLSLSHTHTHTHTNTHSLTHSNSHTHMYKIA